MSGPGNGENARRARVTIREIADLAGVSIATVSRVVNGRDDVSEETREAVACMVRVGGVYCLVGMASCRRRPATH